MSGIPVFFANPFYLQLGPVPLQLITWLEGFAAQYGWGYAQHDIIENKAHLQWVGDDLERRSLHVRLHSMYCIPMLEFYKLKWAADRHCAYLLIWSNGQIEGWFVIENMQRTLIQTDALGNVICMELHIELKEYFWQPEVSTGDGISTNPGAGIDIGGVFGSGASGGGMIATAATPFSAPGVANGITGILSDVGGAIVNVADTVVTAASSAVSAAATLASNAVSTVASAAQAIIQDPSSILSPGAVAAVANGIGLGRVGLAPYIAAQVADVVATGAAVVDTVSGAADFIAESIGGPIAQLNPAGMTPVGIADAVASTNQRLIGLSPYISANPGASSGDATQAAFDQVGGNNSVGATLDGLGVTPISGPSSGDDWAVSAARTATPVATRQSSSDQLSQQMRAYNDYANTPVPGL